MKSGGIFYVVPEYGIDVWDYAEMYTLQRLIEDIGAPAQKLRLRQEIVGGR